ncbi:hypothetical protein HU200_018259 [Digitaria exilis]|uniref:Fe2OG dioxygenase domain-containing protein n=1 Tax=Digitaria exilis TaxID=1010633 RepID=A0A835KJI1_9POAL|nr:hypothetical protein HU200_018259 [Digitaria exilis]
MEEAAAAAKLISRDRITDAAATILFSTDDSVKIPERFVRTDEVEAAGEVVGEDEAFELPVVDMAKLLDPELSASETAKLGAVCRDWGFFQLTSHGVDEEVIRRMKESAAEFFRLPLESKNAIAFGGEDKFQGFGHHFSTGPAAAAGKLDWAECVFLVTQPVHGRKMELWPPNPPSFRDALDKYSTETTDLTRRLLRFMAADLGVSEEALVGAFFSTSGGAFFSISGDVKGQSVGIHHYPPCRQPEKVLGISPHTDWPGLTVLLHAVDTPGLQVRRGGRWLPVRPLPGALVVNVGDILHVLTNGEYMSAEHRVVPDAERCRITVAMFQDASVDGMVAPLPELLEGGQGRARYRSIGKHEYTKGNFVALAEGARFLDSLKK